MILGKLYEKALCLNSLTIDEGMFLYDHAPLEELMFVASQLRQKHNPGRNVGWMIDRNVNIDVDRNFSKWEHNSYHRRGVSYNNVDVKNKFAKADMAINLFWSINHLLFNPVLP